MYPHRNVSDKHERLIKKDHKIRAEIEPTSSDNRSAILRIKRSDPLLNWRVSTYVSNELLLLKFSWCPLEGESSNHDAFRPCLRVSPDGNGSVSVQDDLEITNKIDNLFKYEKFIKEWFAMIYVFTWVVRRATVLRFDIAWGSAQIFLT
jgi:hypothetical protein